MKVYYQINDIESSLKNSIVTTGTFDGVHLGHKKILDRLIELKSKNNQYETVVVTFWPHPKKILTQQLHNEGDLITSLEEKINLLDKLGIDHLLIIPFTREFSELSSHDFIQKILIDKIDTKLLVIGYDHRFGKNREGSFEFLNANANSFGFQVEEIPRQDIENSAISSTSIRNLLKNGTIEQANELLGYPYHLSGIIAKGQQLGRTIGFPTANIDVSNPNKLIPADGVYAVWVKYMGYFFKGMMNIGFRPTVNGLNRTIEVHILDFEKDIYGEKMTVYFIAKIRDEQKFKSLDSLKEQLKEDKHQTKFILKNIDTPED